MTGRYDRAPELLERAAGRFVPVARVLGRADVPPDLLLERLARPGTECALLESGGERTETGRYSFLACAPRSRLVLRGDRVFEETGTASIDRGPSLPDALDRASRLPGCEPDPDLPPFARGAVGYMAYDAARHLERLPDRHARDSALPDALFLLFDGVVAIDHLRGDILALTTLDARDPATRREKAQRAEERLERLETTLRPGLPELASRSDRRPEPLRPIAPPESFLGAVARAREAILDGEAYQVVLSRRWEGAPGVAPLEVYRALRSINPSPYMFYLHTREGTVLGASPEMLVRCRGRGVLTRPIAGTVRRGRDASEDRALAARLTADPKERAEHVMLVDLARNDLGRVCEIGTVRVTRFAQVEAYSHVQHLVSDVEGTLASDRKATDALAACFPAGTLTGAPKIRAMELIEELEGNRRGLYGGAVGYLDATGNLDMAIAIRTAVAEGDRWRVQAGAGIVADSIPQRELAETEDKAAALFRAVEQAQRDVGPDRLTADGSRLPRS